MPSLVEFLRHVLPSKGWYCWVALKKGEKPQQGFTQSLEDLAVVLQQIDATGWDAYFACAAYKEPGNRRSENAKCAQSLWLDIDAGPGKPYPDAEAAIAAVDEFCAKAKLPQPTIVYSGGGVHAYWKLAEALEPGVWVEQAKFLKRDCEIFGLQADPARTSDISSILRPPGTYNWKLVGNPRPVECLELMDGITPIAATEHVQFPSAAPAGSPRMAASTLELNKAAGAIYTHSEPSYASVASSQCNQLRHFRETRGNIPEPLWYAGLGLLAGCEDGLQCAHEWSAGHPSYSRNETDKKFNQAKEAAGATTCERFKSLNPSGCVSCPFTITSPIVLGRNKPAEPLPVTGTIETFPPLPPRYGINQKYQLTVEIKTTDEKGIAQNSLRAFTNYPIFLVELRDGENDRKQGYYFRQWEPAKGWVEFEIGSKVMKSMGVWGELADHGAGPRTDNDKKHFSDYISAAYTMLSAKGNKMRFDQFGWKDDFKSYYYGGLLYKTDGTIEKAAGNLECTERDAMLQPAKNGSLANWTYAANKLFVVGCEAQSFGLLSSFASVLMSFITPPGEGGAVLSLVTPMGGKGKSTTLAAIASVWGKLEAIRLAKRDTANSKFRIIGILNTLPVIFDELRDRDPEQVTDIIEGYTIGRDKNRAKIDGSIKLNELSWKNIMTTASNLSVVDTINSVRKIGTDPMGDRVFEVELKVPPDVIFSHGGDLGAELMANRGYAGKAFITYLMQPGVLAYVQENLKVLVDHYVKITNAPTPYRYPIRLIATCAIAGRICKHLGLMEFSVDRIIDWAVQQLVRSMETKDIYEPVEAIQEILKEYVVSSCIIVPRKYNTQSKDFQILRMPAREVQMRYEVEEQKLYVSANWMSKRLAELGIPVSMLVNALQDSKILLDKKRRTNLTGGTGLPGASTPCWEINMKHPDLVEIAEKNVLSLILKAV